MEGSMLAYLLSNAERRFSQFYIWGSDTPYSETMLVLDSNLVASNCLLRFFVRAKRDCDTRWV